MAFEWYINDTANDSITIYPSNITLNTSACNYFKEVKYVLLGLDSKTNQVGIKPITKEMQNLNLYPKEKLHKISIGKSYGRISDRNFINTLQTKYHLQFSNNQGIKYSAKYDQVNQILIAKLKEE